MSGCRRSSSTSAPGGMAPAWAARHAVLACDGSVMTVYRDVNLRGLRPKGKRQSFHEVG
jgi:hypothetical protein